SVTEFPVAECPTTCTDGSVMVFEVVVAGSDSPASLTAVTDTSTCWPLEKPSTLAFVWPETSLVWFPARTMYFSIGRPLLTGWLQVTSMVPAEFGLVWASRSVGASGALNGATEFDSSEGSEAAEPARVVTEKAYWALL